MKQSSLVGLLKETIDKKEAIIKEYEYYQDPNIDVKKEILATLNKDIYKIIDMDFKVLEEVINKTNSEKDAKEEIEQVKVACKLLRLNLVNGTTIPLDDEQRGAIELFLKKLNYYVSERVKYNTNNKVDIKALREECDKYQGLINYLKNPKNTELITDVETIEKLFNEREVSKEDREAILVSLMRYNKNIYDYKMGKGILENALLIDRLDEDEVKKIFDDYGYKFNLLDDALVDFLLEHATIINITEVFEALRINDFPHIDEIKYGYVLVTLLIAADRQTISETTFFATRKGIRPEQLLTINSCLIKQTRQNSARSFKLNDDELENTSLPYIVGASKDFQDNIVLLENYGYSIKHIFDKCRELLIFQNSILKKNLQLFQEYGFSLKENKNRLLSPALSSLISLNFAPIVDQFIETHPYGLQYVRDNLSVIRMIDSPFDILFYNLYYSNKVEGPEAAFRKIVNNNVSSLCLRGTISRWPVNYREVPFMGIEETNKNEITGCINYQFKSKGAYLEAIKKDDSITINVEIFDNPYIQKINNCSDQVEPLIYNFDGVRISKLKVLRIFSTLIEQEIEVDDEALLFAITYNSLLTQEEFDKIINVIKAGEE